MFDSLFEGIYKATSARGYLSIVIYHQITFSMHLIFVDAIDFNHNWPPRYLFFFTYKYFSYVHCLLLMCTNCFRPKKKQNGNRNVAEYGPRPGTGDLSQVDDLETIPDSRPPSREAWPDKRWSATRIHFPTSPSTSSGLAMKKKEVTKIITKSIFHIELVASTFDNGSLACNVDLRKYILNYSRTHANLFWIHFEKILSLEVMNISPKINGACLNSNNICLKTC